MVLTKFISFGSIAGSCVTSDTRIIRDIFYNGNPIREKCTIILRIAPTFLRLAVCCIGPSSSLSLIFLSLNYISVLIFFCFTSRFGSFEIFKPTDSMTGRKGPSVHRTDILGQLLDYTVKTFFPQVTILIDAFIMSSDILEANVQCEEM